jgi:hypothetical protein
MRKKNHPIEKEGQSMKMLVLYGSIVVCVILGSLFIKAYSVIQDSKFNGQNQFIVAIGTTDRAVALLSFEPLSSSLSVLHFPEGVSIPFSSLNRTVGIIPDGYIRTSNNLNLDDGIPSVLQSFLFTSGVTYQNITFYDVFRFWFYSKKLPSGSIISRRLSSLENTSLIDKTVMLLFVDSNLANENISLQIINATGESGLGGRLARVMSNLGGNVVSVRSSTIIESSSKIQYYDPKIYTLQKLHSLLPFRHEKLTKKNIAEIIITIGTDSKNTDLF